MSPAGLWLAAARLVEILSVRMQPGRPAGAGMMMVPVGVDAEHCYTAYRSVDGTVKLVGVDAFELEMRLSLTP